MNLWNLLLSIPAVVLLFVLVINIILFFAIIRLFSISSELKKLNKSIKEHYDEEYENTRVYKFQLKEIKEILSNKNEKKDL